MSPKQNLTKVYLRILGYIKPHILLFILATLLSVINSVFLFSQVWLIRPFLGNLFYQEVVIEAPSHDDGIFPQTAGSIVGFLNNVKDGAKNILDNLLSSDDPAKSLLNFSLFLIIVTFLKNLIYYLGAIFSNIYLQKIYFDLRKQLFAHIQTLHLDYFSKNKMGHLMSRITNDIKHIKDAISASIVDIIRDGVQILALLLYLLYINWQMTLYITLSAPIIALFMNTIGKYLRRYSTRQQVSMGQINSILQENFSGIRVVKGFGREDYEIKRFNKEANHYYKTNIKMNYFNRAGGPFNEIVGTAIASFVLFLGGRQVILTGSPSPESFIQYIVILLLIMQPLRKLSNYYTKIQAGLAAGVRVFGLLDTKPMVLDEPDAIEINEITKGIKIENVSFKYEGSEDYALKNVSIDIDKGQTVALVGKSGAGKSTLADLLIRFHDVTEGRILIDGNDIRSLNQNSLRHITGIVTQETILFNDTIAANVAYGDINPDRQRIVDAAKVANAWQFISKLPNDIDSIIGDRGIMISGGERQRLAIARAIYRNPHLLIFDEATSSLDTESEKLVQEAIDRLLQNRTALIIAHRLSTIAKAQKIFVLENGYIAEEGTHEELLKKGGIYRELYDNQFDL